MTRPHPPTSPRTFFWVSTPAPHLSYGMASCDVVRQCLSRFSTTPEEREKERKNKTPHSNKLQFSLGPGPLNSFKNTTKHRLTLSPLYALNSSTHFNLTFPTEHLSSRSPGPVPSLISSLVSPPSEDTQHQVCQGPFDEERMLLCDICDAGWHMAFLLPPLTTIPAGIWKCPLCTPSVPSSQGPLDTSASPPPS